MTKKTKRIFKALLITLSAVIAAVVFSGCAGDMKQNLVGSWGYEDSNRVQFTLYDDATCKISDKYGTGHWDIVNGNLLKLTDFYGVSNTAEIKSANGKTIEFASGYTYVRKDQ